MRTFSVAAVLCVLAMPGATAGDIWVCDVQRACPERPPVDPENPPGLTGVPEEIEPETPTLPAPPSVPELPSAPSPPDDLPGPQDLAGLPCRQATLGRLLPTCA